MVARSRPPRRRGAKRRDGWPPDEARTLTFPQIGGAVKLLAGTSGFAFKEWKGPFYPEDLRDDAMLAFYAQRFPTVEINNTFYRLPREHVLREWAGQVPQRFSFAIKASQRITHFARLKPECAGALEFLLASTSAMGDKLGPILFQLPPNLKLDADRLRAFLALLPPDRKYAIEFRHESWFTDDTFALLRERDIPMVITEQPEFASPVLATASWGYARLHRLDYDTNMLEAWAKRLAAQPWNDLHVYFKHDEGIGSGPPAVSAFVDAFSGDRE
jgi:uncharacterized protein YecE (DUF72 family)